jgi:kynurenine 3-monooxygenase
MNRMNHNLGPFAGFAARSWTLVALFLILALVSVVGQCFCFLTPPPVCDSPASRRTKLLRPLQDTCWQRPTSVPRGQRPNLRWGAGATVQLGGVATTTTTTSSLPSTTTNNKSSSSSSSSSSSTAVVGDLPSHKEPVDQTDAVVCGGGPAGLLAAIMLAQQTTQYNNKNVYRFTKIQLFDRLAPPPRPDDRTVWNDVARFYLIGLGGRGQAALAKFKVWDEVKRRSVVVVGRRDWSPGGPSEGVENIFKRAVTTHVLPRDKLSGVLYQHIRENYPDRIQLNYGYEVQPIDFDYNSKTCALVRVSKCVDLELAKRASSEVKTMKENPEEDNIVCDTDAYRFVSTKLLVAADGTVRTIANAIEALDNQRVYKTVPLKIPTDWRPDLNYSVRTSRINFDALPANDKGSYCGVLLLKKDDPLAQANVDPAELRKEMDESMPQFSALLSDETIAAVAQKPVSYLPRFRYVGPRQHEGNSCVILGDCAHTVKPYFGLGANSALEDVEEFADHLQANPGYVGPAVQSFSRQRAPETKTLVRVSRDLDRPGLLGFVVFILPIILDSIFGKLLPQVFKPNIITMLQMDSYTFQRAARRKRLDRLLQVCLLIAGFVAAGRAAKFTFVSVAKLLVARLRVKNNVFADLSQMFFEYLID